MLPEAAIRVDLPEMHDGQMLVLSCPARFRVLSKGRRGGGTFLAEMELIIEMIEGGDAWSISPTYPNASERWEELKALCIQLDNCEIREEPRTIKYTPSGGRITVKAATVGDSLRGSGLTLIVCHEFAFWEMAGVDAKSVWTKVLRPMLMIPRNGKPGRALFESSPNGINYFSELLDRGWDPLRKDWQSFEMPSPANPLVTPQEVEDMLSEMTEEEGLQEVWAKVVDIGGLVFRRVAQNAIAVKQDRAVPGHSYVIGVDLAKSRDYSVFAVIDLSLTPPSLVHMDRQGHVDYTLQVKRLKALCDRFHPQSVLVEANNAGSAVIEQMQLARIPNLKAIDTDNHSKAAWVENLSIALENDAIHLLNDKVLLAEMGKFAAKKLPSGLLRYAAIGQNHDDTVMALLIAFSGVQRSRAKTYQFASLPTEAAQIQSRKQKVMDWLFSNEAIETVIIDAEFVK